MKTGIEMGTEVERFVTSLEHPFKPEILELRKFLLEADGSVREEIKWNSLSFRTSEFFATFHLREKKGIRLILHFGAKKRETPVDRSVITDPCGMLSWLGPDRASVVFRNLPEIRASEPEFKALIREWIAHL